MCNKKVKNKSCVSKGLVFVYQFKPLKKICWYFAGLLEGGELLSVTQRIILDKYHGVEVGAYSYGYCMKPRKFPRGVTVGRYVSIAADVQIFLRNHPYQRLSTHPFFYNANLNYVKEDTINTSTLIIGHDVWVGYGVIITPGCSNIGNGAVIAAGSIVTKDVDEFSIVAGTPAKLIKKRFSESSCLAIKKSKWWEYDIDYLLPNFLELFLKDVEESYCYDDNEYFIDILKTKNVNSIKGEK